MAENKCEKLGMVHAWEDIETNIVYTVMPPQYPAKKRQCLNCGKVETEVIVQKEIKEWR